MASDQALAGVPLDLREAIDRETDRVGDGLVRARRHLHRHPELSWKEHETANYLTRALREAGLEPRTGISGTGIVVDIEGAEPGPLTAYRADMDGIAIGDGKCVDYASVNPGVMHACGHDFHAAIALGVASVAHRLRHRLHGRLRVFFQPAEENVPAGAYAMIDAGVMEGVSSVYAIHCEPALPAGKIGLRYGMVTASADMFDLLIKGRAGHSSRPYLAVDAILIATKVVDAVYQLVNQRIDPLESAVINVGTISGGDAANILCGHVTISGAIRCFNDDLRRKLHGWLEEIAVGIARGMGGEAELSVRTGAPPLTNASRLVDRVRDASLDVVGPEGIVLIRKPSMGGEDFSFYTEHAPGALIRVGTSVAGSDAQLHNELFDAGDEPLSPVLRVMVRSIFSLNAVGPAFKGTPRRRAEDRDR